MAELERLGYITHPHTSAGRIPTDRGYRYYVSSLMPERDLSRQMRKLDALDIPYDVTPGVPAFAAAAAALKTEFTLPEVAQTVILTRTSMQSSAMPPGEELEKLGASRATLAIHLSIRNLAYIERALTPHYGADCPVVVAYRITWPDEMIIRGATPSL